MKITLKKLMFVLTFILTVTLFVGCKTPELKFEQSSFELKVGEELVLSPVLTNTKSLVEYTFDKEGIVEITDNKVKALSVGEVKITANLKDNKEIKAELTIKVIENHVHDFKEVVDDKFLASEATCSSKAKYYKSCECGAKSEETFEAGEIGTHVFDQEVVEDKYLAKEATCTEKGLYYKSCKCGEKGEETFEGGDLAPHVFDQEVADDKYLVSPINPGDKEAHYYKSCKCGEKGEETFTRKLGVDVTSVKILNKFDKLHFDESVEMQLEILPEEARETAVITWEASDSDVEFEGNTLTNGGIGKIKITVRCGDKEDSFEYTSYDVINEIKLEIKETTVNIGDTITPKITILPETANQEYIITLDPEDALKVNEDNSLTALKSGVITVTVTSKDDESLKQSVKVRVRDLVESIRVTGDSTMFEGKTQTLKIAFTPSDFIVKDVVWSSSDDEVASVDQNGVVTSHKAGEVTIKVESQDAGKCVGEFKITVNELPKDDDNAYVSEEVGNLESGSKVTFKGVEFTVGQNAFGSFENAVQVARKVVYIGKYELQNAYTLTKSGLTFIGNGQDSKITAQFSLADGVTDITFDSLVITGSGQIKGISNNENITVINCNCNGSKVDSSQGTIFMSGNAKNLVVKNTTFLDSTCARSIRNEAVLDGLVVDNCEFGGSGLYEGIRSQGTIKGIVTITNCVFNNATQTGIMFMSHDNGTYVINNNKFYNIIGGAIDIRLSVNSAPEATFEIMYNIFDNTGVYSESWDKDDSWGCLRFRAKGYTLETIKYNANYNQFIKWGTVLLNNAGNTSDLVFANLDYNYFDKEVTAANFENIALSFDHIFKTIEELNAVLVYKDINSSDEKTLVVGENANVTKTKYATLADALKDAKEGYTIYMLPGTHTGDAKIALNNLTITSLNGNINPNSSETRFEEAIYEGTITIDKEIANLTISGIKFVGSAKIKNTAGPAGTAKETAVNLTNFVFKNNYVSINHTSGNGFMDFKEGSSSYSHNTTIINNYFTTEASNKAEAVLYLDNTYNLVVEDNVFENITGKAFYVNDTTKGLSGEYSKINSNFFKNVTNSAIHINWMSPLPLGNKEAYVEIENNNFENIGENAIYLGQPNNSDNYASFKLMFNKFKAVKTGVYLMRVQDIYNMDAKYNVFYDVPTDYYYFNNSKNTKTTTPAALDATLNVFYVDGAITGPSADKFSELVKYAPQATSIDEIPAFNDSASAIAIKEIKVYVGDEKQLEIEYTPKNTVNVGVIWQVSDETIATVDALGVIKALKEGKVTVTAIYKKNTKVMATLDLNIETYKSIEVRYEGKSIVNTNETLKLETTLINLTGKVTYTSLNPDIATVDENGVVTGVKEGTATIVVKLEGTDYENKIYLTVKDVTEYSELMQLLINAHNENVMYRTINYIGYESGYESVPHDIYGSVNAYYAGQNPEVIRNMLPAGRANNPGYDMKSIEFIVVHDTGSASPGATAKANSNWCTNASNTGSSWHYTIGNDGLYQQIEENKVSWHAGDGTDWGETTVLQDTGVKFTEYRPKVTISDDGYFVINGQKTTVASPRKEDGTVETRTNQLGILAVKGANGNYFIPTTWISSGYSKPVCIRGGNINGIGIESAVNTGSDVYFTWQRLAKLVAELLVKHDLLPDRVTFHNNFSNKTCPNTMITNNLVDMFLEMVYTEYAVAKNYADYKIEFISNNPDIIDNTGRVVNAPESTTMVSYTIKLTKGSDVEEVTLHSVIPGTKTLHK